MTRKFTMTPIEPRTAGTLKGFGFTVTWGDKPASHVAAAVGSDPADQAEEAGPDSSATHQPETANQSTAALTEVQGQQMGASDAAASDTSAIAPSTIEECVSPPAGIKPRPSIPPKPVNDDFPRIQVIGSIR